MVSYNFVHFLVPPPKTLIKRRSPIIWWLDQTRKPPWDPRWTRILEEGVTHARVSLQMCIELPRGFHVLPHNGEEEGWHTKKGDHLLS